MTNNIEKINQKIKNYYDHIKLSWKTQDNFNFKSFINEIKQIFELIDRNFKNSKKNIWGIFQELFEVWLTEFEILNDLEENISDIEKALKEIKNNFYERKEIFLDFDFFRESQLLTITLNNANKKYPWYLWNYYILALKSLLVLWKNEINLLDESMSFHHREKSKLDIKKVKEILEKQANNNYNLLEWQEILKEILEYSEFLCHKFDIIKKENLNSKYNNYLDIIKFSYNCSNTRNFKDEDLENFKGKEVKTELELYKIFMYFKDVKYKNENESSYNKLKNIFKNFNFSENNKNTIFFINNLISILNKIAEKWDNKFNYDNEIKFISNFISENNIAETYFTFYKFAELYKNLWKINKDENQFQDSESYINSSIIKFEEQNWAYYPFIATSEIFLEEFSWIFSYSTFIIPEKTDYYLKIKKEQIKVLEEKSKFNLDTKLKEINKKLLENENKISDNLHNNQVKTIEILAIFSAIIMFVSSSIQVYQYLSDTKSAIIFMISFALSLFGFIWLIIFIIWNKLNIWKFIIFIIIFIIGFGSLYYLNNIKTPILNQEYKEKIKEDIINDLKNAKIIFN